ncbi:BRCT domain-containing protein [Dichotomocladium elegans]|nr:BRCT domain-containing protein [Dichotomocladium elegans]
MTSVQFTVGRLDAGMFWDLEETILKKYGEVEPENPTLHVRHTTQTSLTLEWEPLKLHTAELRSLEIYKNGTKLAQHVPANTNHIKLSGLDVDHEYEFHLVMKTTSGQYESNRVKVRTHKMEDLTGIVVTFGEFQQSEPVISEMKALLDKIGAAWTEEITHDTTHLIAQVPRGSKYEMALTNSIPVVKPDWLVQCDKNKKIQPSLPYYIVSVPSSSFNA